MVRIWAGENLNLFLIALMNHSGGFRECKNTIWVFFLKEVKKKWDKGATGRIEGILESSKD